jgi:putative endonuclease
MKDEKAATKRMTLGRRGEDVACGFLSGLGHTIIGRNLREGHLEIDIVSLDRNGVHFVEVKSRVAPVAAAPEENVTAGKQRRIAEAAARWLRTARDKRLSSEMEINFDVVAVTFERGEERVEWFPNAWYPMF